MWRLKVARSLLIRVHRTRTAMVKLADPQLTAKSAARQQVRATLCYTPAGQRSGAGCAPMAFIPPSAQLEVSTQTELNGESPQGHTACRPHGVTANRSSIPPDPDGR